MLDKVAMVYGQMNEPPGNRLRVALTGLTMAERSFPTKAATSCCSSTTSTATPWPVPKCPRCWAHAVRGGLPADAGRRNGRACRSASPPTKTGSITSIQAVYTCPPTN